MSTCNDCGKDMPGATKTQCKKCAKIIAKGGTPTNKAKKKASRKK